MSNAQSIGLSRPASRGWHIGLWTAQIVLAVLLAMAGTMKTFADPHALPAMGINWAADVPVGLLRFIGVSVLPALTRILPGLTPPAATCFLVLQLLAIGFHATRGETAHTIGLNLMNHIGEAYVVGRTTPPDARTAAQAEAVHLAEGLVAELAAAKTSATLDICAERACPLTAHPDSVEATR
jgi:uncharacterized membrane protein YphA (DoxX/SURF4 family)